MDLKASLVTLAKREIAATTVYPVCLDSLE